MSKSIKKSKKCRVFKDGGLWCCVGPKFVNIQESASGFGATPEEAHTDYLADVTAMKAARTLAKAAKKATPKLDAKKKKKDVHYGKVMASRRDGITEHAKVQFICGATPKAVVKSALAFNLTMELPLGDKEVKALVAEVADLKSWISDEAPQKKSKKCEKGSRNTRIHKSIVKAFKKGTNRNGVISLALIKNNKFNSPLPDAEVLNLVRVEWERLNPPSE